MSTQIPEIQWPDVNQMDAEQLRLYLLFLEKVQNGVIDYQKNLVKQRRYQLLVRSLPCFIGDTISFFDPNKTACGITQGIVKGVDDEGRVLIFGINGGVREFDFEGERYKLKYAQWVEIERPEFHYQGNEKPEESEAKS